MATKTIKPENVKMPLKLRFGKKQEVPEKDIEKAVEEVQEEIKKSEEEDVREHKKES